MPQRIFVTTDTHFGAEKFSEDGLRPKGFSEMILSKMGMLLNPSDLLIHLGDVCHGDDVLWHQRLAFIECKKWLVLGRSHDKKSITWYLDHGWDAVNDGFRMEMFGKKIMFSHMPVMDDGWYDINIHGHFHTFGLEKVKEVEPELFKVLTPKHKLIALEALHYEPIKLQRIVEDSHT